MARACRIDDVAPSTRWPRRDLLTVAQALTRAVLVGALWVAIGAAAAAAGDLAGTVRLVGTSPPPLLLRPAKDEAVCGAEPRPSGALVVSPNGGVGNAVVSITHERLPGWRSPMTFEMDQRRCAFVPRVVIVPPGSTVEIVNSDGILHNFHTRSRLNPPLNLAQPRFAKPLRLTFAHPEVVPVVCDLHGEGLMRAWIVVAVHPYYALTDADGRFHLPSLPPGPHVLQIWHEALGTKEVPVTIGVSGIAEVTVPVEDPASARQ